MQQRKKCFPKGEKILNISEFLNSRKLNSLTLSCQGMFWKNNISSIKKDYVKRVLVDQYQEHIRKKSLAGGGKKME